MNASPANGRERVLGWMVAIAIIGYATFGRTFAHLGVTPLYVGELMLVTLFVAYPQALELGWLGCLLRPSPFGAVAWALLVSLLFGSIECLRGLLNHNNNVVAVQNLVFHVYPLFFFTGLWVGAGRPEYLPRVLRALAWILGIYGILYIGVFSPMGLAEHALTATTDETVAWAGQPCGAALALLGLISFEERLQRCWLPLLLDVLVFLGIQMRAAWLGMAVALPVWGLLTGRTFQLVKVGTVVTAVLAVLLITDFSIPAPTTRGGDISARAIVGRAVAAIDVDMAYELTPDASQYAGTVSWRTEWWKAIWDMVHADSLRALVGPGYGYPIWDLHPEDLGDRPLRTPHNIIMYALGYTGWVGVAVFVALQLAFGGVMWRVYRQTGRAFGFCWWLLIMAWAPFDNSLENPYAAIPFYLVLGLAAAPLIGGGKTPAADTTPPTDDASASSGPTGPGVPR